MMLGYPSIQAIPLDQVRPVVAAYVRLLGAFSDGTVGAACLALSQREGAFVPSAGDVFAACDRVHRALSLNTPPERIAAIARDETPKGSDFERRPTLEEWRAAKVR